MQTYIHIIHVYFQSGYDTVSVSSVWKMAYTHTSIKYAHTNMYIYRYSYKHIIHAYLQAGYDTVSAVGKIATFMKVRRDMFTHAGIKDKSAVTAQEVCVCVCV